jgi:hypothetical protein
MIVAATLVTAQAQVDVNASADARVNYANPGTNYGTETAIYTRAAGLKNSLSSKIYCRFDLGSQITNWSAPYRVVSAATLHLRDNSSSAGQITNSVYGLKDGQAGESWGETTITWNNAPANDTNGAWYVGAEATYLGQFTYTGTGTGTNWISFTSSNLVDFLNADTNGVVTLMLSNPANTSSQFASRERTDTQKGPPRLTVTSAIVLPGGTLLRIARPRQPLETSARPGDPMPPQTIAPSSALLSRAVAEGRRL